MKQMTLFKTREDSIKEKIEALSELKAIAIFKSCIHDDYCPLSKEPLIMKSNSLKVKFANRYNPTFLSQISSPLLKDKMQSLCIQCKKMNWPSKYCDNWPLFYPCLEDPNL